MDKSTKFQMRINAELLAAIDAQAEADGMTRTAFFVMAARSRLANAPSLDGSTRMPATKPKMAAIANSEEAMSGDNSCPHGFNTKSFCITMNRGTKCQ